MTLTQVLPLLAYAGCVGAVLSIALGARASLRTRWLIPGVLGGVFLLFSLVQTSIDGPLQFWVSHTMDLTGNQIWFDLLLAVSIGFYLIAPRARAVSMPLLPWGVTVLCTACIGLLPMLARLLWLEGRHQS